MRDPPFAAEEQYRCIRMIGDFIASQFSTSKLISGIHGGWFTGSGEDCDPGKLHPGRKEDTGQEDCRDKKRGVSKRRRGFFLVMPSKR